MLCIIHIIHLICTGAKDKAKLRTATILLDTVTFQLQAEEPLSNEMNWFFHHLNYYTKCTNQKNPTQHFPVL